MSGPHPHFLPDLEPDEGKFLGDLLRSETVGGAIALLAAGIALVWANLAGGSYMDLRELKIGPLDLQHWAADGALSVFFFLAGLELKRELLVGSLRKPVDAAVPVFAAMCGVGVPALLFLLANRTTDNLGGWAIPAATDIAFALAVLAVIGSALPTQVRAFLLTVAVVDDLIVIVIIATVYSDSLDLAALGGAGLLLVGYAVLQRLRVRSSLIYLPLAAGAWWLMHESGVHATIAGMALGLLTRVLPDDDEQHSPAERVEHRIAPLSAAVAVPFFALMSAGVRFDGGAGLLTDPLVIGIVLGLVLGKPIGILGGTWLITRFTRAELDDSVGWRDLVGIAVLGGIGFTVSLLVSELSFSGVRAEDAKAAVLLASLMAAVLAVLILWRRNLHHQNQGG